MVDKGYHVTFVIFENIFYLVWETQYRIITLTITIKRVYATQAEHKNLVCSEI